MLLWVPAESLEAGHVAVFPESGTAEHPLIVLDPSLKATLPTPLGLPPVAVTVAVKSTLPYVLGLALLVTVVLVVLTGFGLTVRVTCSSESTGLPLFWQPTPRFAATWNVYVPVGVVLVVVTPNVDMMGGEFWAAVNEPLPKVALAPAGSPVSLPCLPTPSVTAQFPTFPPMLIVTLP